MQSILTIDPARKTGIAFTQRGGSAWARYQSETIDLSKVSGSGQVYFEFSCQLDALLSIHQPDFIGFEMPTPRSMTAGRLQLGMVAIIQMEAVRFNIDCGWCLPNKIKSFHLGKDAYQKGSKDRLHDLIRRRFSVGENSDETDALALLDLIVTTQATGELDQWLKAIK